MRTEVITQTSIYKVKDLSITFEEKIRINCETKEEVYDAELEQESDVVLYNMYRKEKGLPFSGKSLK